MTFQSTTRSAWKLNGGVGAILLTFFVFIWWRETEGSVDWRADGDVFLTCLLFFSLVWLIAFCYRLILPATYTVTVTSTEVTFALSHRPSRDFSIQRQDVKTIYKALPPSFLVTYGQDYSYAFELKDGTWHVVYLGYGIKTADFASAIEMIWDWPDLNEAPTCRKRLTGP